MARVTPMKRKSAYPAPGETYSLMSAELVAIQTFQAQRAQAEQGLNQVCLELTQRLGVPKEVIFEIKGNKAVVSDKSPQGAPAPEAPPA